MTLTSMDRRRIAVAGLISASVLGLAGCPRHHATSPAPATFSVPTGPSATTLAYPSQISIPAQLAEAVGHARASTASVCARGARALAWAEVDEDGNVTDINSACVTNP